MPITRTVDILGYPVSAGGLAADAAAVLALIETGGCGHFMACANPHSLVVADRDPLFRRALLNADLLIPDGIGVVLASRLLKRPVQERVPGYEFFIALTDAAQRCGGIRYFFLGASQHTLELIRTRLAREYPGITVSGLYSPPHHTSFTREENARMVAAVRAAAPHVLWVGLTAPKQEKWVFENRELLGVPFTGTIGAAFDFYAGTQRRSSPFWCRHGLEWLPRFLREPRRLWHRTIKSAPVFICRVIRQRLFTPRRGAATPSVPPHRLL
ncbi:MAG: hypothetical protein FD174_1646 [Geobacteraceae bacterium]|nr:MAG: hypothetical protein FD174_1646 [Geobacteraceae bacterium]